MSIHSKNRFPTVKQFWHALNAYAGTKQAATIQIPAEEPPVQSPPEPLIAIEQFSPLHTEPIVQQTLRPLIETEEVPSLSANPIGEQTPELPMEVEEIPTFAADCTPGTTTGKSSDYGIWSLSPASSGKHKS